MDQLQIDDGLAAAQPLHRLEPLGRGRKHIGKAAKPGQELLGQRLGITPRDGTGEEKLEQLVVGERVGARLHEPGAQPLAMAEIVRWLARFLGFAPGFRLAEAIPHGPPPLACDGGRLVEALRRIGEDLAAGVGDADGVLELGR
jgi:hypothetical protein